jgi:hypothetical protein
VSDIRELIREIIKQELEEISTTAGTPGYQTPNAFRGNSDAGKAKMKKNATQAGYSLVSQDDEKADKLRVDETKIRYHEYKNDETATPRQKIGRALSEVNKNLLEIDRQVRMNSRLKSEAGMESTQLWKRTNQALLKIDGTLQQIVRHIRELKA